MSWWKARQSTRPLLNRKRDGTWKTRWVMRGDLEDKILLDGPGFDYFASVSRMSTVRLTVLRSGRHVPRPHRPGVRVLSTRDVDTAFLQSEPFPETDVRYVRIRSPIDGKLRYYRQYKPIYGSCSAPVRWQKTFVNWLTKPESEGGAGLVRGHNEPCVFHHPGRDLVLVLYVDDLMVDGYREDHEWLYALMDKSFSCKAPQYLTEETPINHLGVDIFMTKDVIGMSMRTYIAQMQVVLGMQDAKPQSVPMVGNIEDREPLLDLPVGARAQPTVVRRGSATRRAVRGVATQWAPASGAMPARAGSESRACAASGEFNAQQEP